MARVWRGSKTWGLQQRSGWDGRGGDGRWRIDAEGAGSTRKEEGSAAGERERGGRGAGSMTGDG
jgi:hypothetical protein